MDSKIKQVLDFLNRNRLRATYKDVAGFLNVPAQSLSVLLGPHRPAASWVVNGETGKPSGYIESECHPDLRAHDIIADEDDLRLNIQREKKPARASRAKGRQR